MTFQTYLVVCAFSALQAFVHGETRLVYSIGDLHGDFDRFRTILTRIGLATFDGDQATWTGETLFSCPRVTVLTEVSALDQSI